MASSDSTEGATSRRLWGRQRVATMIALKRKYWRLFEARRYTRCEAHRCTSFRVKGTDAGVRFTAIAPSQMHVFREKWIGFDWDVTLPRLLDLYWFTANVGLVGLDSRHGQTEGLAVSGISGRELTRRRHL